MAAMLAMLLVRVMAPRLDSSEVTHRSATNYSVPRPAPEGVWVLGGGIEIPCEYCMV